MTIKEIAKQLGFSTTTVSVCLSHRENDPRYKILPEKAELIREYDPNALCLGSGGCRICKVCAWPEACRFPEKACSSMEGYGLFVTQVCRDNGLAYHHGDGTITFTACVLFNGEESPCVR